MKLSRTVGLAVAVSLIAATVAALAQISGVASTVRQTERRMRRPTLVLHGGGRLAHG